MPNSHLSIQTLFADVADAIRGKEGSTAKIVADNFPDRIRNLPSGGGEMELSAIAEVFNAEKDYHVNDYVTHSSAIYRFIKEHIAGEWDDDDVVPVPLADDVTALWNQDPYATFIEEYATDRNEDASLYVRAVKIKDAAEDIPVKNLSIELRPTQDLGYWSVPHDYAWAAGEGENLVPFPITGECQGIVINVDNDRSKIKLTGAYSGSTSRYYELCKTTLYFSANHSLTYYLSGVQKSTYTIKHLYIQIWDLMHGMELCRDTGDGAEFTIAEDTIISIRLFIESAAHGLTLNETIKLEITSSEETCYTPYEHICPIFGKSKCDVIIDSNLNQEGYSINPYVDRKVSGNELFDITTNSIQNIRYYNEVRDGIIYLASEYCHYAISPTGGIKISPVSNSKNVYRFFTRHKYIEITGTTEDGRVTIPQSHIEVLDRPIYYTVWDNATTRLWVTLYDDRYDDPLSLLPISSFKGLSVYAAQDITPSSPVDILPLELEMDDGSYMDIYGGNLLPYNHSVSLNCAEYIFTGSEDENWGVNNDYNFYFSLPGATAYPDIKSTHFQNNTLSPSSTDTTKMPSISSTSGTFNLQWHEIDHTPEAIKAWCAEQYANGTPLKCVYKVNPQSYNLSNTEIMRAMNAIQRNMHIYNVSWEQEAGVLYNANINVTTGHIQAISTGIELNEDSDLVFVEGHEAEDSEPYVFPYIIAEYDSVAFGNLLMCDRMRIHDFRTGSDNETGIYSWYDQDEGKSKIALRLNATREWWTLQDFRSWLSANPIQCVCELITLLEYDIEPTGFQTFLGKNKISLDQDDDSYIDVTYRADTSKYIDNKVAELEALLLENS